MKLKVLRADPAGNITLFVLDPVAASERAAVAARLMDLPGLGVEQVGFLCPPADGCDGRVEMMGGEVCGNAARAFGLLLARARGGADQVRVQISGCGHPVTVKTDLAAGTAQAEMPLPRYIERVRVAGHPVTLVHLGGIAHLVAEGVEPCMAFFREAEPLLAGIPDLDAYGVIFQKGDKLTPLVKVPATGSLVWEGSCGSGALAANLVESMDLAGGEFVRDYIQPAGTVRAGSVWEDGRATGAWIGGSVVLGEPFIVEL